MGSRIGDMLSKVASEGGEEFILARDKAQAESMRVTAFNLRRRMHQSVGEDIGIQKIEEDGRYFLRIFKRGIEETQVWVRDPVTKKLVPVIKSEDAELERIVALMRQDGKSEEEIAEMMRQ